MSNGRYGTHGGQYVPETLMNAVLELQKAYETYKKDPQFIKELQQLYHDYANRPSLLYYAERMTQDLGGAKIYLKREDLNHTGAHKINNALGQCLLAKKMGKKRIIAETGAGQHGVATATVAALLGLECVVYMGKLDTERQALNVYRMKLLGADVVPVETGTKSLKDAVNEALREWSARCEDTAYCIGSVMGLQFHLEPICKYFICLHNNCNRLKQCHNIKFNISRLNNSNNPHHHEYRSDRSQKSKH